jgi:hypothetical protein
MSGHYFFEAKKKNCKNFALLHCNNRIHYYIKARIFLSLTHTHTYTRTHTHSVTAHFLENNLQK